jgi:hypothetical protein
LQTVRCICKQQLPHFINILYILSHNDPLLLVLIFFNFIKHKLSLPEDEADASKHVGELIKYYGYIYIMGMYIYIYIHTHTHTHTHTYIYIYIYTHTYTYLYIHIYLYIHTHTYIYLYIYTYIYIHTHKHIHIHTYIDTHICMLCIC